MDLVGPAHGKLCLSSDASSFSTKHVTLTFNLSCNTEAATPVLAVQTLRSKLNAMSVLWPAAPPQPHLQTSHAGTDPTSVDRDTLPCYLSSSRSLSHFSCSMSQLLVLHSPAHRLCQFNIVTEPGEKPEGEAFSVLCMWNQGILIYSFLLLCYYYIYGDYQVPMVIWKNSVHGNWCLSKVHFGSH